MLGSQRRARVGGRRVGVDVQKPLGVPMTECSLELVTTRWKEQLKVCAWFRRVERGGASTASSPVAGVGAGVSSREGRAGRAS
jgi:hypothetical protein